ncbi:MAG: hypothetical protein ABI647_13525 [Gemmatimonadota bacterium]
MQFTAAALWSDGSYTAVDLVWAATGGSVTTNGLYTAGTSSGSFYVAVTAGSGRLTDTARVTLDAPVPPIEFPASFDPARLGSSLLAGNTWREIVTAGTSDNGWANLVAAVSFTMGSTALPTNPTMLGVYPDATFSQALQITNRAHANGMTAQSHNHFAQSQTIWVRWTMRVSPGFTSSTDSASRAAGESGTYKLAFLWPVVNRPRGRLSFVLTAGGEFDIETPATPGATSNLFATDATTPPPQPYGSFQGFFAGDTPKAGGPYAPSNVLTSGDWYAFTINVSPIDNSSYLERWFVQRLTENGVWNPWLYPTWKGFKISGTSPLSFDDFWLTGNKSGAAALEQFMWLGPFEVTSAADPYGWDHYGR